MKIGIDVSSYQNLIDWKKVKEDGIEFAILKIIRKDLNPDNQFENNWKGCTEARIPIHGVYNYSYATTVAKAKLDANKVLEILNGRKTRVYLDVEDVCQKGLGKLLIDIINSYSEIIKGAGLEFGVYTGLSFYNSYIKPFGVLDCPLWVAKYYQNTGSFVETNKPNVEGMVGWQFTSKGKVEGINGNVDMNVLYEEGEKMEYYANKVVELAKMWIGKNEADETHREIIDIYNKHKPLARGYAVKYSDSWCATFVSAVSIKLGYTDIIPTECGCQQMIEQFKKIGCWYENENRITNVGDIIFYDWQDSGSGDNTGWSDHVGIVEKVSNGCMTIIEGNYNDAVGRRVIDINARYIRGYGVPKYSLAISETETTPKRIETVAKEVIAGKWGVGEERKEKLTSKGYYYEEVQKMVNQILSKTAYYPKYNGNSNKVDEVLASINVPDIYVGNKTKRKPVGKANGFPNYTGKQNENLAIIYLAKQGKLKKP